MPRTESSLFDEWDERIASEFAQCPGLRLTAGQAARLWGLQPDRTGRILARLVGQGLVFRTAAGVFVQHGSCPRCE